MHRRPDEVLVRYEIRPLGDLKPGMEAVPSNGREMADVPKRTASGKIVKDSRGRVVTEHGPAYDGRPRPLGYLGPAVATNDIRVTQHRGVFRSTFTNGILSAQWLRNVLEKEGILNKKDALYEKICDPDDGIRKYLAGDVVPLIRDFFQRPGKFLSVALRVGGRGVGSDSRRERQPHSLDPVEHGVLDRRRRPRRNGISVHSPPESDSLTMVPSMQNRMFNNSTHIGHNKFVVHVPSGGGPRAPVLTGSTNWTSTGLAGQSNNAILVENDAVAGVFLDYWKRMKKDELDEPKPLSKPMKG